MTTLKNQTLLARMANALAGLGHAVASERSLRFQLLVFTLMLVVLAIVRPGALWTALVLLASGAVLAAELFNTALEALSDLLHPAQHPQIKIVKDCAAAAVLIASLAAVGVGVALAIHLIA